MIDKDRLAVLLLEFEEEYSKEISEYVVEGFCVWPYVKTNCYFGIINSKKSIDSNQHKKEITSLGKLTSIIRKVNNLLYACYFILKNKLKPSATKRGIAFFTFSIDKYLKDEMGRYYNHLVDGFITNNLVNEHCYIERSWNEDYKEPCVIPVDIKISKFDGLGSICRWKYSGNEQIEKLAYKMSSLLDSFFKRKNTVVEWSELFIRDLIIGALGQYKVYNLLLRSLNPILIISSEQPGTSLLAAANALGIPSIDLQHGVINNTHPQYIYSSKLNSIKSNMAMPSSIGVFGEIHKNILLERGYWSSEEMVVLGSRTVDDNRKKYIADLNKWHRIDKTILIPTQWTAFNELLLLLNTLGEMHLNTLTIIVKIHPAEPESNITEYIRLTEKFPRRIIISGKEGNTYELIKNAFFVIGFDTAVLLESVALGVPCITITTKEAPYGIHGMLNNDELKSVILAISIDQVQSAKITIQKAINEEGYYNKWMIASIEKGFDLYADNYVSNCRNFITREIGKNKN